jgi:hypothetical protein
MAQERFKLLSGHSATGTGFPPVRIAAVRLNFSQLKRPLRVGLSIAPYLPGIRIIRIHKVVGRNPRPARDPRRFHPPKINNRAFCTMPSNHGKCATLFHDSRTRVSCTRQRSARICPGFRRRHEGTHILSQVLICAFTEFLGTVAAGRIFLDSRRETNRKRMSQNSWHKPTAKVMVPPKLVRMVPAEIENMRSRLFSDLQREEPSTNEMRFVAYRSCADSF